ncbi:putative RING finger protein [Smittium culicis]|uniref:Putative RING finger protein n=1 Tax=Smittium culicis TaxID=133412 RepID=A0A1R1X2I0_9FUNG|nr:putative RING finger protein [Smittium culicis]
MMGYRPQNFARGSYSKPEKSDRLRLKPPDKYVCFRCGQAGHWIQECPTLNYDPNLGPAPDNTKRVKRTTGIPKSFLQKVEKLEDGKHAMVTSDGTLVVATTNDDPWNEAVRLNKTSMKANIELSLTSNIPNDLKCSICSNLVNNPLLSPCCNSIFCAQCIEQYLLSDSDSLSQNKLCPVCSNPDSVLVYSELTPSNETREKVEAFLKLIKDSQEQQELQTSESAVDSGRIQTVSEENNPTNITNNLNSPASGHIPNPQPSLGNTGISSIRPPSTSHLPPLIPQSHPLHHSLPPSNIPPVFQNFIPGPHPPAMMMPNVFPFNPQMLMNPHQFMPVPQNNRALSNNINNNSIPNNGMIPMPFYSMNRPNLPINNFNFVQPNFQPLIKSLDDPKTNDSSSIISTQTSSNPRFFNNNSLINSNNDHPTQNQVDDSSTSNSKNEKPLNRFRNQSLSQEIYPSGSSIKDSNQSKEGSDYFDSNKKSNLNSNREDNYYTKDHRSRSNNRDYNDRSSNDFVNNDSSLQGQRDNKRNNERRDISSSKGRRDDALRRDSSYDTYSYNYKDDSRYNQSYRSSNNNDRRENSSYKDRRDGSLRSDRKHDSYSNDHINDKRYNRLEDSSHKINHKDSSYSSELRDDSFKTNSRYNSYRNEKRDHSRSTDFKDRSSNLDYKDNSYTGAHKDDSFRNDRKPERRVNDNKERYIRGEKSSSSNYDSRIDDSNRDDYRETHSSHRIKTSSSFNAENNKDLDKDRSYKNQNVRKDSQDAIKRSPGSNKNFSENSSANGKNSSISMNKAEKYPSSSNKDRHLPREVSELDRKVKTESKSRDSKKSGQKEHDQKREDSERHKFSYKDPKPGSLNDKFKEGKDHSKSYRSSSRTIKSSSKDVGISSVDSNSPSSRSTDKIGSLGASNNQDASYKRKRDLLDEENKIRSSKSNTEHDDNFNDTQKIKSKSNNENSSKRSKSNYYSYNKKSLPTDHINKKEDGFDNKKTDGANLQNTDNNINSNSKQIDKNQIEDSVKKDINSERKYSEKKNQSFNRTLSKNETSCNPDSFSDKNKHRGAITKDGDNNSASDSAKKSISILGSAKRNQESDLSLKNAHKKDSSSNQSSKSSRKSEFDNKYTSTKSSEKRRSSYKSEDSKNGSSKSGNLKTNRNKQEKEKSSIHSRLGRK